MPSRRPLPGARLSLVALLAIVACHPVRPDLAPASRRMATLSTLVSARPADVGLDPRLNHELDSIAAAAIARRTAPAVAIAVGRYGRLVHLKGYGHIDWAPGMPAVDARTMFDLASLTKVVATTTAAMMLEEAGLLDVDSTVAHYLPEFAAYDTLKARITLRMLLTHTGGLEAYAPLYEHYRGRAQYLEQIARRPLKSVPGTEMVYSDWDMIVLQQVLERITGEPLDVFCERRIFAPLGMHDTHFLPDPSLRPRIAATAVDTVRGGLLWGVVHDGNAWAMGGVSGHAGLFSSAADLAVFAQFLLNGGEYGGVRLLHPATIARWTARQDESSSRALGWDTPSPPSSSGRHFSARSFGHTGFTGTSLWVDPERGLFVIVLTNRVNSEGSTTTHAALRRDVADAVQEAVLDAPLMEWERAAGHAP
ncbi:MAG TPA: serine hydrolase [Gemmatimonadaceae bacterium]|nr:serine hydrolase [Gemmatimonadaceae bacterium]